MNHLTENCGGGISDSVRSFTVTVDIPSSTNAFDISNFQDPEDAQSRVTSPMPGITTDAKSKIDEKEIMT
jgi:hypothetical protein